MKERRLGWKQLPPAMKSVVPRLEIIPATDSGDGNEHR
jgi:hypothetical protein